MKIELKNIQHTQALSEETNCFSATVYIDGQKTCTVSNRGHGGCHMWSDWAVRERINAYAQTLPPVTTDIPDNEDPSKMWVYQRDADALIDDLLVAWLEERDLKKALKSRVLYQGEDGQIYQTKKLDAATRDQWLQMPDLAAKLKATKILNLLPLAEALDLYRNNTAKK